MRRAEQRVDAFLRTLEKNGATVIWIGLPPMKDDVLGSRMDQVNRIEYSVVNASPHAIWFSTSGLIGDPKGHDRNSRLSRTSAGILQDHLVDGVSPDHRELRS